MACSTPSTTQITPTNLLLSRAPTDNVDDVLSLLEGWEDWVSGVIETHSTFPMLRRFRSKYAGQNWVTAIGLLSDAGHQCQLLTDARDRALYWLLRRSIILFNELTKDVDLSSYRAELDASYEDGGDSEPMFRELYDTLAAQGFNMVDFETGRADVLTLRRKYDAQLEYLIDETLAPRGFWGHHVGHQVGSMVGRGERLTERAERDPS